MDIDDILIIEEDKYIMTNEFVYIYKSLFIIFIIYQ